MPQSEWILFALLMTTVSGTTAKTVVFLPFPVSTNAKIFNIVANELAQLGHDVWLATPSAFEKRNNENSNQSSIVKTFSYSEFLVQSEEFLIDSILKALQLGSPRRDLPDATACEDILSEDYFHAMRERCLLIHIQKLNPNLIVLDLWPRVNEFVAIPYKLDIPFAFLGPIHDPVTGRIPFNAIAELSNSLSFRTHASFYEKVTKVLHMMYPLFYDSFFDRGYISKIAPEKDKISTVDLMSKGEVYIVECDHILDYPKPTVPNVKFVGGISPGPARDLQEPFKTFVHKSEKDGVGIAVVSFGSLVLNLPRRKVYVFLDVFEKLKLNVIWRANLTSPNPDKILTSLWIPQNDLLGQKKVKVFISHCGTHGIHESLYHAVPIVCLPIFFDQFFNSERTQQKGYGLGADFMTDSVEELVKTIEDAAYGPTVRPNMTKASEIYHQLYKNPGKDAAFWFDHVMKYGGSYMRSSGQIIPMVQFIWPYKVFIFIGVFLTLMYFLVIFTLAEVCSRCCKKIHDRLK